MTGGGRGELEYIVPLRWADDRDFGEMAAYLNHLARHVDVTLVDGSPDPVRRRHAASLAGGVRLVAPDFALGSNGKAAAVLTAAPLARHESVVIADDDVRYSVEQLHAMSRLLDEADIVRPQNYFDPLPWHARWDTARSLLNRAFASDYPGTLGIRRHQLAAGYDADVLFENLELIRTVIARDGVEHRADDFFVRRLPPSFEAFLGQRVRHAYDSFAQPPRLIAELLVVPALVLFARRPGLVVCAAVVVAAVAEVGRRRREASTVFPPASALWAPLWLLERGVCAWVAVVERLRGGVRYRGIRMLRAASSTRALRAQHSTENQHDERSTSHG